MIIASHDERFFRVANQVLRVSDGQVQDQNSIITTESNPTTEELSYETLPTPEA